MAATRDRALEAAIALVGDEGLRALSHGRVDARAALPRGSTSNWFRTRRALLDGVVEHIVAGERSDLEAGLSVPVTDVETFVDMHAAAIELLTTERASRTRARYSLFLEQGGDGAVREPLRVGRARLTAWTEGTLAALGAASPAQAAVAFMAVSDGLILHRLAVDPSLPVQPAIRRMLMACLQP